jgi:hypothetical protein
LDFAQSAEHVAAMVRGLDHGGYANPLALPKIEVSGQILLVGSAEALPAGDGAPGAVIEVSEAGMIVACAKGSVHLAGLMGLDGAAVCPKSLGISHVQSPGAAGPEITDAIAAAAPVEGAMRRRLANVASLDIPQVQSGGVADWQIIALAPVAPLFARALGAARALGQGAVDLAFKSALQSPYLSGWSPIAIDATGTIAQAEAGFAAALEAAKTAPGFAIDLPRRDPALAGVQTPLIALSLDGPVRGAAMTLTTDALHFDAARIGASDAQAFAARLATLGQGLAQADPASLCADLPILPEAERDLILNRWNDTATDYDRALCVHQAFEAQAAKTPDAIAVVFEAKTLTYAALNQRANKAAHVLIEMGVTPGTLVGLCATRSLEMLIGALAIQKAGGAYVPMDPTYPAERIALFI